MKGLHRWTGRVIIFTGAGALVLSLLLTFTSNTNRPEKSNSMPETRLQDLQIQQFSTRGLLWYAQIRSATSDRNTNIINARDITIYWPDRNLKVNASRGSLDTRTMKLTLKGSIEAAAQGLHIKTPSIERASPSDDIKATGGIKVTGKRYTITADEGTIKKDGSVEAHGNVNAIFNP